MGYIKAQDILPEDVLTLVQRYVDGQMLYIPRRPGQHKSWGAGTQTREDLQDRNQKIYAGHMSGMTVTELSGEYFLTEKSIQRIIRNYKKAPPNKST